MSSCQKPNFIKVTVKTLPQLWTPQLLGFISLLFGKQLQKFETRSLFNVKTEAALDAIRNICTGYSCVLNEGKFFLFDGIITLRETPSLCTLCSLVGVNYDCNKLNYVFHMEKYHGMQISVACFLCSSIGNDVIGSGFEFFVTHLFVNHKLSLQMNAVHIDFETGKIGVKQSAKTCVYVKQDVSCYGIDQDSSGRLLLAADYESSFVDIMAHILDHDELLVPRSCLQTLNTEYKSLLQEFVTRN